MTTKEMIKEIKIELSGMPNQEFMPGYKVVSVGTRWVKWSNRSANIDKASIADFYNGLFDNNTNVYEIING